MLFQSRITSIRTDACVRIVNCVIVSLLRCELALFSMLQTIRIRTVCRFCQQRGKLHRRRKEPNRTKHLSSQRKQMCALRIFSMSFHKQNRRI